MRAAVVTNFGQAPVCQDFPQPKPTREAETLVRVLAAGLHPRVRSQADGSHYTSTQQLPLIPGIDGVGLDQDGDLRYFVLPDTANGSMAEWTVVDRRRSILLVPQSDPVALAAGMNPAMSSWIALQKRIHFEAGQTVLVLGATGNAGRLAVQVAKHLGAGKVIGVGRDQSKLSSLTELGADHSLILEDLAQQEPSSIGDVDVVLDYLWGDATSKAMVALVENRSNDTQPLTWIELGSAAGLVSSVPSAALRAARLEIVGSGQGSVATEDFLSELPLLADVINRGVFVVNAASMALEDVSRAWTMTSQDRLVIEPQLRD